MQLGNFTLKKLSEVHNFELTKEDLDLLESRRQDRANPIAPGKFHIFDIPRTILCGDMETAVFVKDILINYKISGHIQISIIQ